MASSLYRELRTARDQHGIAPDASDGVLMLVAQSMSQDPEQLTDLLAAKGLSLDPASVVGLVSVVQANGSSSTSSASDDEPMSFLQRIDHLPEAPPAPPAATSDAAPSEPTVVSPGVTPGPRTSQSATARRQKQRPPVPPPAAEGAATEEASSDPAQGPTPDEATASYDDGMPDDVGTTTPVEENEPPAVEPAVSDLDLDAMSDHVDVWSARENGIDFHRVDRGAVELSWPRLDAHQGALVYLVVGSAVGIPVRPSKGTRLALTEGDSARVTAGSGPYFSVFSYSSADIASLPTAVAVHHAAGQIVPEVSDLQVSTRPDEVVLTWTTPPGVERVRVLRGREAESLPSGFDASLEIPARHGHASDRDVLPGRRYQYRVISQFTGSAGELALSSGREITAEIPAIPEPVVGLTAEVTGEPPVGRVELRWPTPPLGRVVIYQSSAVPEHAATNLVISTAQLEALTLGDPVGEPALEDQGSSAITGLPLAIRNGPRRAFTPVTVIGTHAAVGPAAVVNLLGRVTDLELTERVDRQLLRFAWPAGATFAVVERGSIGAAPDGTPPIRVSLEEYERQGGLRLQLPVTGCDVHVRGAVIYAGEWTTGPVTSLTYPGRWVLRYRFEKVGLIGRRRSLQIRVDRPWRDVRLALTHRDDRLPLHVYDSPGSPRPFQPIDGASVPPGEWHTVDEVTLPARGFSRVFAHLQDAVPIVIDPALGARVRETPPTPLRSGRVRCVRCMQPQDESPQLFRCAGSCPVGVDHVRSTFAGYAVQGRPVFPYAGHPVSVATCPSCHEASEERVCKLCHGVLPPDSSISDPVSVAIVGARGTGKTTYILSLLAFLQQVWGPASGASAAPVDAHTSGRLRQLLEPAAMGRTVGSTVRAEQNPDVLAPMLLRLDHRDGRQRTLALYDVAGEDVENPLAVRPYGSTLANADALLFLVDPLQLPPIRSLLEGQVPLPPIAGNPLVVMENVIAEIRRRTGSPTIDVPIAVALSKIDGIHRAVRTPGTNLTDLLNGGSALMYDPTADDSLIMDPADRQRTHEETRSLLLTLGAGQFVHMVEAAFTRTEYFALSALGHAPAGGTTLSAAGVSAFRVADPLRWLVDRRWPVRR
ncbi:MULTISPECIES: TRAFAC clade GTPase domain-containing protein [unclassified Blastococcus]